MRVVASVLALASAAALAATAAGRVETYKQFRGKVAHRYPIDFTVKVRHGRITKVKELLFINVRCGGQRVSGFEQGGRPVRQHRFKYDIPAENFSVVVRGKFGKRWRRATGTMHLGEICNTCEPAECWRNWTASPA